MGSALPAARLRWQFGRQLTTDLEPVAVQVVDRQKGG